jgi:hypothetical protein
MPNTIQPKNDSAIHMTTTLSRTIPHVSRFREEFDVVTAEYPPGYPAAASFEQVKNKDRSPTNPSWKHVLSAAGRCFISQKSSKQHRSILPRPELEIVAPIPQKYIVASSPSDNSSVGSSNDVVSTNIDGGVSKMRGWTTYVASDIRLLKKLDTELYREGFYASEGEAGKDEFVKPVDSRKGSCEGEQSNEDIMEWGILIDGL